MLLKLVVTHQQLIHLPNINTIGASYIWYISHPQNLYLGKDEQGLAFIPYCFLVFLNIIWHI